MRYVLVGAVVAMTIFMIIPSLFAQSDFVAAPLQNPVTLDGRFSSATEWSDAWQLPLETGVYGVVAHYYLKYDSTYLYMMWDFVECTKAFTGNTTVTYANQVYFYINPSNKQTDTIDSSMYRVFIISSYQGALVSRGTMAGGDWTEDQPIGGTDLAARTQYTGSPNSPAAHMIVEMRVALTWAGIKSNMATGIGFAMNFYDAYHDLDAGYPTYWRYKDPTTWGSFEFSTEPVPEFPVVMIPMLATLVLVFALTRRRNQ